MPQAPVTYSFQKVFMHGALFLALLLTMLPAWAQTNTGTILGTVQDDSGAVIPEALVIAKNLGTGQERSVKSDSSGFFTLPNLQIGEYSITITHGGFARVQISNVELQVAQRATLHPVMHVGRVTSMVTVAANETPLLEEASSSIGQVVGTRTMVDVPLNGRDFWQLTQLTPGVNYVQGGQNIPTGGTSIRASAVNVDVNGLSPSWTGWYLDGANITEFQLGGTIIQPNVDALQEFKVESSNMGADYGHSPTIINATLKSGTNQFHGALYEFVRNNSFDAANYFFTPPIGTHERDEPLHRNQFGLDVGGPVLKDKTFFFLDAQSTLFTNAQDFANVVPSDQMRSGDFTAAGLPVIKDPTTGQQVSNGGVSNVIPPGMISPQAQYLLKYMPHANSVIANTNYAILTNSLRQQLDEADLRIDQDLSNSDRLMGRYSLADNHETDPNPFPLMGGFPLRSRGQDALIRETHIFNQSWINEAQISYYRSFFLFRSSLEGQNINDMAGIQGFDGLAPADTVGFPTVNIANYSKYSGQGGGYPKQNKIRSMQYVDRATYSNGRHDITLGYELFHDSDSYVYGYDSVGVFTFNGKYSGDNFADFLMGYPRSVQRSYFRNLWGNAGNFQAFYAQDDYRMRKNLTINAGIRWEINPFYNALKGQMTGFDPATAKLVIPSNYSIDAQPGTPTLVPLFSDRFEFTNNLHLPESIRKPDWHNVAPRLGFAMSPGRGDTVIRGAYGMFYLFVDDNAINNTMNTVPFVALQTLNNTTPTPTYNFANYFQSQPIVAANPNPSAPCSFGFVANSCSTPDVNTAPLSVHNTYIQEYNLAVQHEFGQRISLEVAYVGNLTSRMVQGIEINDPAPGPGIVQARRPLPQWGRIEDYEYADSNYGNYNALQSKLQGRGFAGASFLVSYTYGKCLVTGGYNTTKEATSAIQYYGPCSYNLTHNLVANYVYDLPFGRGRQFLSHLSGVSNGIVGDWGLSGILTAQSGLPFTPTISGDQANTGVGGQRPNVIGTVQMPRKPTCWFYDSRNSGCGTGETDAFAVPAKYAYGNGGFNTLTADHLLQFDVTLMKSIRFTESSRLEFRVSFYNVFNHPTFGAPSTNIDSSSAGQVSKTLNAARQGELAMKFYF